MNNIIVSQSNAYSIFWFVGWLFSIGYLKLSFGKAVLAIVIWPYYIGEHYRTHHHG